MKNSTSKEFTLTIGIHSGTLTSRDFEEPKFFDTLEECKFEVVRAEIQYARIGCYIWFAHAIDKEDNITKFHPGTHYSS
jgi:hypothetical protein